MSYRFVSDTLFFARASAVEKMIVQPLGTEVHVGVDASDRVVLCLDGSNPSLTSSLEEGKVAALDCSPTGAFSLTLAADGEGTSIEAVHFASEIEAIDGSNPIGVTSRIFVNEPFDCYSRFLFETVEGQAVVTHCLRGQCTSVAPITKNNKKQSGAY